MLAVYNSSTLEGIACIVYLLCDLVVYVYAQSSSGAFAVKYTMDSKLVTLTVSLVIAFAYYVVYHVVYL